MKLMNLFNRKGESSETSFGSNDKSSKAFFISKEDYDEDKIHSKEFKELAVTLAKKIGLSGIYSSEDWNVSEDAAGFDMFMDCFSLPNFDDDEIELDMATLEDEGGYLSFS